jgi:hypothetical protein
VLGKKRNTRLKSFIGKIENSKDERTAKLKELDSGKLK